MPSLGLWHPEQRIEFRKNHRERAALAQHFDVNVGPGCRQRLVSLLPDTLRDERVGLVAGDHVTHELHGLAGKRPDAIVLELGDGLLGAYGVEAILEDEAIRKALTIVVLCANDPVSAWGGARILRQQFNIEPAVVSGPATDNDVGIQQIDERMSLPAINALANGVKLGDMIAGLVKQAAP